MAGRREKLRHVGIIPEYRGFTPDGLASGDAIDMTVDELEVLRLCDLEGLNQEAVAQHMGIARTTVAAICSRAHRKVANALVNGRAIVIEGGNIAYSPITTTTAAWPAKEVDTMRVATTYDNGNIFMHFGRSEQFKIYDIQDGKVLNEQVVGTGGTGHGALAGLLANGGVDTLICGGIGGGAINALTQAGIKVYAGAQGNCDACVKALIAGALAQTGEATCDCHGHDHEHIHEHGGSCGCHGHHENEGNKGCGCH
ncbi:NifB/NifX family molybdenum-iron cluster-binding protein [Collinsella aerofaciens]|uniref:NifB/NifX family molybdenum-iron cluster-binding protein n=1 Tax=Collinsella aerofaciens TaxID=74426 RepID=UPI00319DE038